MLSSSINRLEDFTLGLAWEMYSICVHILYSTIAMHQHHAVCLSPQLLQPKSFLSVNINKHSFVAAWKGIFVPRQHSYPPTPSPPSYPCLCEAVPPWLQNDGAFAWRKKKHGSLWYASPLHAFPSVLLAGHARWGQIIVGNLARSSFSFLCLVVMMVSLLRCNGAWEPITDSGFS